MSKNPDENNPNFPYPAPTPKPAKVPDKPVPHTPAPAKPVPHVPQPPDKVTKETDK